VYTNHFALDHAAAEYRGRRQAQAEHERRLALLPGRASWLAQVQAGLVDLQRRAARRQRDPRVAHGQQRMRPSS
jgi:hypothetical protein